MIGIVLSGGQSSRMGLDKGLMTIQGNVWSKVAFEKLAALSIPSFVSVNNIQLQEYLKHFNRNELFVDRSDLKIQGPLAGVLNAHLLHPDQDVMVLACDMPEMQLQILEKLKREFQAKQPEAIAFKGINIEPLCAIYSKQGLAKIKEEYDSSRLANHSMTSVLEFLKTSYLPIREEWQQSFKNFNHADDLR